MINEFITYLRDTKGKADNTLVASRGTLSHLRNSLRVIVVESLQNAKRAIQLHIS